MTPNEALHKLLSIGWKPAQIAELASISVAAVSRIRHNTMQPSYMIGEPIVTAAKRGRKPPRRKTG